MNSKWPKKEVFSGIYRLTKEVKSASKMVQYESLAVTICSVVRILCLQPSFCKVILR